jgi:hypothetical protein
VLRIFIALAGFEPANFESSGKHTNHYTTKAICHIHTRSRENLKPLVLLKKYLISMKL